MGENAKLRDVVLSIRADESIHRDVNHRIGDIFKGGDKGCVNCELEIEKILDKDYRIKKESASGVEL